MKKDIIYRMKQHNNTCSIISLGCPKNLVDSETMIGRLTEAGFEFCPTVENVDAAILNTCGFLQSARDEAIEYLEDLLDLKRKKIVQKVIVTGCFVRSGGGDLARRWPEVDAWISPFDEAGIVTIVRNLLKKEEIKPEKKISLPVIYSSALKKIPLDDRSRKILTFPHTAYLKIADGCDRFCSYCSIPMIRGRFTSKSEEAVLDEAKRLAGQGVKELILIAQETSFWGSDLYGSSKLTELMGKIREISGLRWIRVLYTHPYHFNDELISFFAQEAKRSADDPAQTGALLLPYIDIPLQHANDEILQKMNRKITRRETEDLLTKFREQIPGVVLRTSFITGFPGETDDQFGELIEFVQKWKFERAGVFSYSAEPGTKAAEMSGQVPEKVKQIRNRELSRIIKKNVVEFGQSWIGSTRQVLIDQQGTDEAGNALADLFIGRTRADSPDIDPAVYVTGENLTPGEFYSCEIVDVSGYDFIAVPVDHGIRSSKEIENGAV